MSEEKERREKGAGGLRWRADKGRWEATLDFGVRPDGRRERRTVTGKTQAACEQRMQRVLADRAAGRVDPGAMTVRQFLDRWVAHLDQTMRAERPRTYRSYADTVRLHIAPRLGAAKLAPLSPADVEVMLAAIRATGHARTAQYARTVLRIALAWGMKQRWIGHNAAALADAPPHRPREAATLTVADARRIIAAPHRNRVLWLVALTTGLRRGELIGLRWADVDLDAGALTVAQQGQFLTGAGTVPRRTKTDRARATVLLAPFVVAALRQHRRTARGPLVFATSRGTMLDPSNLRAQWVRLLARLGIPYVRFHAATRHTCASLLFAEGVEMRIIQSVLRHTRIGTTSDVYTHLTTASQGTAAAAMERLFGAPHRRVLAPPAPPAGLTIGLTIPAGSAAHAATGPQRVRRYIKESPG